MTVNQRPSGVVALAILEIALGVLLFTGFMFAIFPKIMQHFRPVAGTVLLMLAIVDFTLAFGLWKGKRWAWTCAMIFALVGIVFSSVMLFTRPAFGAMTTLIVEIIILYYLLQPKVQRHFGKSKSLQN
ncbi:MAG TPA: DUF2127 domain-containing protein [Candidatus Saccharimonadales bacterium]|nr:DUF2127 domain-containing protein [Candidatus Saccharimonadales bacterium]